MWKPIDDHPSKSEDYDLNKIDVWMAWGARPSTFGVDDAFRVCDVFRHNGEWVHFHNGEMKSLRKEFISHYMDRPSGPNGEMAY